MSKHGSHIPAKLKHDAILEAIFELRFETSTQFEFLLVRFADSPSLANFKRQRLPAYDMPETLRRTDPNLRYQPLYELHEMEGRRSIRIGPEVLSYHVRSPYIGWTVFKQELDRTVTALGEHAKDLVLTRLGLRYINGLSAAHNVRGFGDLDISVKIGQTDIESGVNVNFTRNFSKDCVSTVRVATREFIQGATDPDMTVIADVDVYTPDPFRTSSTTDVLTWLLSAHATEKLEFFGLLKDGTISALEETE